MLQILNKAFVLTTLIKTSKTSKNTPDILNLSVKQENFKPLTISIMADILIQYKTFGLI